MTDAAKRLGLHRSNLYRKMRQLSHDPERVTKTGAPRKKAATEKRVQRSTGPVKKKKATKTTAKMKTTAAKAARRPR